MNMIISQRIYCKYILNSLCIVLSFNVLLERWYIHQKESIKMRSLKKSTAGHNMPESCLLVIEMLLILGWPLQQLTVLFQAEDKQMCLQQYKLSAIPHSSVSSPTISSYHYVNHERCLRFVSFILQPKLKLICRNWGSSIYCQILRDSPTS